MEPFCPENIFILNTPAGSLEIALGNGGILMSDWVSNPCHTQHIRLLVPYISPTPQYNLRDETVRQLEEYFAGTRKLFTLPILTPVGTVFQQRVWNELRHIAYGTTVTYGEIAKHIGSPQAVRAVGTAIGCNPLSILIPCHRVLAAGRKLGGYAGGLESKETLLDLENKFMEHIP